MNRPKRVWWGGTRPSWGRARPGVESLDGRVLLSRAVLTDYHVTQDWGSGFQAEMSLANQDSQSVSNWTLDFDFAGQISSIWDAQVVSHTNDHYVVKGAGWNNDLAGGGRVSFGFVAAPGHLSAPPANLLLNGEPLTGSTNLPPPPPSQPPPPPVVVPATDQFRFQVQSDWGSGFTGQITVANPGASAIGSWTLAFDFAGQIGAIWNATVVSHVGNHYVVSGADWNRAIPAGGTVSFGFNASPGGNPAAPTSYRLSDGNAASTPVAPNQAPTARADLAQAFASLPVSIAVLANDVDPDHDALAIASVTKANHGSVVANADGTIRYTPAPGFTGTDMFSYVAADGRGGTSTATVNVSVLAQTSSAWPDRVYAPYVDMALYPTYDLATAARAQGIRYFTLAFIVADPSGRPSWGGYPEYAVDGQAFDLGVRQQLAAVRSLGGDAMVSFGGAANRELAEVITDPVALANAYRTVIDAYQLTHIDFDIEGAAAADHTSIDRRSQAIATLQGEAAAAGRELNVAFTLPVLPTGLTHDGLYVLQSALRYGVRIDGVNIMAMDYGDSAAPNPQGHMGDYTIAAAESLFSQLQGLYGTSRTDAQLWATIGLTPMIGVNDVATEVFDLAAAQQVADFAARRGIGRISIWSLNRDVASPRGALSYAESTSSSIVQDPFAFCQIFLL